MTQSFHKISKIKTYCIKCKKSFALKDLYIYQKKIYCHNCFVDIIKAYE